MRHATIAYIALGTVARNVGLSCGCRGRANEYPAFSGRIHIIASRKTSAFAGIKVDQKRCVQYFGIVQYGVV